VVPVVGERKAIIIAVMFSLFLVGSLSGIVFASSENWVEVARFSGDNLGPHTTESFTCEHDEFRVIWECVPNVDFNLSTFIMNVETVESFNKRVDGVVNIGSDVLNGTLYITDNFGIYCLAMVSNVQKYTIIVEQNIDSIPEFPSWIILPIFATATVAALVIKKRINHPLVKVS